MRTFAAAQQSLSGQRQAQGNSNGQHARKGGSEGMCGCSPVS
jgi:hypothetical protein